MRFIFVMLLIIAAFGEPLSIDSVSTYAASTSPSLRGSLAGGRTLYINGLGFDPVAQNNLVFVGSYPCQIPAEGVTTNFLICETTDAESDGDVNSQEIQVLANAQIAVAPKKFHYKLSDTPYLYDVFPSTTFAGDYLYYYGVHRVVNYGNGERDMGEFIGLYVGDSICSMLGITQGYINYNNYVNVKCQQAALQEAGRYNIREHVVAGLAKKSFKMQKTSSTGEQYDHTVLARIQSLSKYEGYLGGQDITITGTGFSADPDKVSVTVDATPCDITSSTINEITCHLQGKDFAFSSMLDTDSSNQVDGYISGAGFAYERWGIGNLHHKNFAYFKSVLDSGSHSMFLITRGVRAELETTNMYGSYYGQAFKGYFYAPVTGNYTFRGSADDSFGLYISDEYGSATVNPVPLIHQYHASADVDNHYISNHSTALDGEKFLEGGKYYYMEVYHINIAGGGFLKISTSVPNNNTNLLWQTHEVNQFSTSIVNEPQIRQFRLDGATQGNFTIYIRRFNRATLQITYFKAVQLAFNASATSFNNALKQFDIYKGYTLSTTVIANGTQRIWSVRIKQFRSFRHYEDLEFDGLNLVDPVVWHEEQVQPHCPLLSGTFKMLIGNETDGIPVFVYSPSNKSYTNSDIPYDVSALALQNALRRISGFERVQVQRQGQPSLGAKWIISYLSYQQDVPDLNFYTQDLEGGPDYTRPRISFFQTRKQSPDLYYNPIDENFLFQSDSRPNLLVVVNDLMAICKDECRYTFLTNTSELTSQSLSGSTLTLSVSNPQNQNYTIDDFTVTFDELPCTSLSGSLYSFTCQLQTNSDGSPTIRAGSHYARVKIAEYGVVPPSDSLAPFVQSLSLSSVNPNAEGANGGFEITLTGEGFPLKKEEAQVQICGVNPTIIETTNIQTKFMLPSCQQGNQILNYTYNNETAQISFTYNAVTNMTYISSISPASANPTLKTVMKIFGVGFGNNASAMTIHLANSSGRVYQMRVVSVNDTLIECGIPGGLPGRFEVLVNVEGFGDIPPLSPTDNDFVYELIIDSISPTFGSYYGGTLITVTGRNFSPDIRETQVFLGNQINWFCVLQTVTTTQITCRTPTYHPDWKNVSIHGVTLYNRLIAESICSAPCLFTYQEAYKAMSISSVSPGGATSGSGVVTINGGLFAAMGGSPIVILENVLTDQITEVVPNLYDNAAVKFDTPSVQAGKYKIRTRVDPVGESNSKTIKIYSSVTTSLEFSTEGGNLPIPGRGLPSQWPSPLFSISMVSNGIPIDVEVPETSPTRLSIKLPKGTNGQVYTIRIRDPNQAVHTVTVTQKSSVTPTLSILTSNPLSPGPQTIVLNRTSYNSVMPSSIKIYNILNENNMIVEVNTTTQTGTQISLTETFAAGEYAFRISYDGLGYAAVSGTIQVQSATAYTASPVTSSFAGGKITVTGSSISEQAIIKVGSMVGKAIEVRSSQADFQIPPLITSEVIASYPELEEVAIVEGVTISDGGSNPNYAFDSKYASSYWSNSNECYIGLDVGEGKVVFINRIRYFPYNKWTIAASYIKGAQIEGSKDGINYSSIATVDQTVHAGWNSIMPSTSVPYRFIRLRHGPSSKCRVAQLQVHGVLMTDASVPDITSFTWPTTTFSDGFNTFTFNNAIEYREDKTPIVDTISPSTGDVFGGYNITLTGSYLDIGTPQIFIDGIQCVVQSSASSQIVCEVGERLEIPSENSFTVTVDGKKSILREKFIYIMRWSDIRTWGTDLPPIEDDLVYVPKGMSLYVDQTTPKLVGIIVEEGSLIFSDQTQMEIHAGFITVNRGQFIAGTEAKPYQNKLTFIMYGDYYGKQQPIVGNKGIVCIECKLSMYGRVRTKTWTLLATPIVRGDTSFTVEDTIDWEPGQKIVVASTDYNHRLAEEREILSVSGKTVTVTSSFRYNHFSGVQNFGSQTLQMKAEVGLLTRNIKMRGDSTSVRGEYGSHLMMLGSSEKGMVAHIAYTQFTHCGQPRIIGRYCIHFHMNGDVADSYVKGNAVHHSFARVITLHAIYFLRVTENVGYIVKGHNFFIEDGIQTQNVIQYNLAISSLESWNMMQTDISVASFWITNPTNHLSHNHAAGGDFYGFWYEIKPRPDGPSATSDVCPIGNPLGESHHNVAHSYKRFGLRIFKLTARQRPCGGISSNNPSVNSVFSDYVTYRIGEAGILAEQTGDTTFKNCLIADSGHAGIQFYTTVNTGKLVLAENLTIVGRTSTNPSYSPGKNGGTKGIIAPRLTSGWKMSNIKFHNFYGSMTCFETCSGCNSPSAFTNTGQNYLAEAISYNNINSKRLRMTGVKREMIYDLDGTFSEGMDGVNRTSARIIYFSKHLGGEPGCSRTTNMFTWDNTLVCDDSAPLRKITFSGLQKSSEFKSTAMKIEIIQDIMDEVPENSRAYTAVRSTLAGKEPKVRPASYTTYYMDGRIYNIWWHTGIDFKSLSINVGALNDDNAPAIIFKFNYTLNRELYDITDRYGRILQGTFKNVSDAPQINTCQLGEYLHSNYEVNRTLAVCASSRGQTSRSRVIKINAIYCRYLCPPPIPRIGFEKEEFVRLWSNASQWPNGRLPAFQENVTIPIEWTILMDINPQPIQFLEINGDVYIPQTNLDAYLSAQSIWIHAGSLNAGTSQTPFPGKFTIQIYGNKSDAGYVFSPEIVGNKEFVVTGSLHLYGKAPQTVWTRLIDFADAGDNKIMVESTKGWEIGDQIVIGPSFSHASQHEKVTIIDIPGRPTFTNSTNSSNISNISNNSNISDNEVIFQPPLRHNHYGAPGLTISNEYGTLDTRTAVGHLTRPIKITPGEDTGWGFRLLGYGYRNGNVLRTGNLILSGVEVVEGGQYDTESTAIQMYNMIGSQMNIITKSSIHDCKSFCLDIDNGRNIRIENNVFYKGRVFHVRALHVYNYKFSNNLMMIVTSRPTLKAKELIACYGSWLPVNQVSDRVTVSDNLCVGSSMHGFAIPYVPCDSVNNYAFAGNTVGTSAVGFVFNKAGGGCMAATQIAAYACRICQIASSGGTRRLMLKNFMMADCGRAVTLRFGLGGRRESDMTGFLEDSYITAISRPECRKCYGGGATDCTGNHAVRMLAVTVNGESLPHAFGSSFDVICKEEAFDSKAFLTNVTFENYNQNYGQLPQCRSNVIFRPHSGASDMTGSHHLHSTVCRNCSLQAYGRFDPPSSGQLGWFGGCGNFLCTGKNNYLVHDWDGTFLPTPGVLIANNSVIGDNTNNCTFIRSMNGHYCSRQDFGVLEYESIAPDFNKRIMWPVYLWYDDGHYRTKTNAWKQWQWSGGQPLNRRLARFVSVIEYKKIYNMTFASEPPHDMRLQFQKRSLGGNPEDFIIVKLHYPRPNSIRIQARRRTVKPISLLDNNGQRPLDNDTCGSNKYFFENYTVHFVITGDPTCMVRVSLTNSIQLHARFMMSISEFYKIDGSTKFIDRMCALLSIKDTSRVKIVGIYSGSVSIYATIEEEIQPEETSEQNDNQAKAFDIQNINEELLSIYYNGTVDQDLQAVGFGPLIYLSTKVQVITDDEEVILSVEKSDFGLILSVSLGGSSFLIMVILTCIYMKKKRMEKQKIMNLEQTGDEEILQKTEAIALKEYVGIVKIGKD